MIQSGKIWTYLLDGGTAAAAVAANSRLHLSSGRLRRLAPPLPLTSPPPPPPPLPPYRRLRAPSSSSSAGFEADAGKARRRALLSFSPLVSPLPARSGASLPSSPSLTCRSSHSPPSEWPDLVATTSTPPDLMAASSWLSMVWRLMEQPLPPNQPASPFPPPSAPCRCIGRGALSPRVLSAVASARWLPLAP
uniref:Uncharacterized protein n=1 Tax=Oryza rufipogon TaxID=4529 RepID=A0A0E0QPG9_ORYRU